MSTILKERADRKIDVINIRPTTVGGRLDRKYANKGEMVTGAGSGMGRQLVKELSKFKNSQIAGMELGNKDYLPKMDSLKKEIVELGILSKNDIDIVQPGGLDKYEVKFATYKGNPTKLYEPATHSKVEFEGKKGEPHIVFLPVNVADHPLVNKSMNEVMKHVEEPTMLFNVAGIQTSGNIETTPDDDIDAVINVNMKGSIYPTIEALPEMMRLEKGSIIFIGSVNDAGGDGAAYYSMTKASLPAYAAVVNKQMIRKGFKNIKAAVDAFTYVGTPMITSMKPEVQDGIKKGLPRGEYIEVEDAVDGILTTAADIHQRKVVRIDDGHVV